MFESLTDRLESALGKIKGLIFVLLTIFLQNLILIPALLFLGVSSIKLYKSIVKDRRKENIKVSILKHSIVSIFILIILIIIWYLIGLPIGIGGQAIL